MRVFWIFWKISWVFQWITKCWWTQYFYYNSLLHQQTSLYYERKIVRIYVEKSSSNWWIVFQMFDKELPKETVLESATRCMIEDYFYDDKEIRKFLAKYSHILIQMEQWNTLLLANNSKLFMFLTIHHDNHIWYNKCLYLFT